MLSQILIIILLSLSDYWPNMQPNFQRQVTLLSLIPRAPRKISVNELVERLVNRTQDAGKRSVQRDLKAMYEMGTFGLRLDNRSKPYGWSIESCWRGLNLDLMDQHMALALTTLKRSASQLMPPQSLQQLQPYFERADKVLASDPENPWLYWACRVAQLPEPYPFILPSQHHYDVNDLQIPTYLRYQKQQSH